jgi:hypothetical protein
MRSRRIPDGRGGSLVNTGALGSLRFRDFHSATTVGLALCLALIMTGRSRIALALHADFVPDVLHAGAMLRNVFRNALELPFGDGPA